MNYKLFNLVMFYDMHGRARSTRSEKQSENQDLVCKDDALKAVEIGKVGDMFCSQRLKSMIAGLKHQVLKAGSLSSGIHIQS